MSTPQGYVDLDPSHFPLWDPAVPLPDYTTMEDLDVVTHVAVERAQPGGYHYLHESSPVWHGSSLYICWANHRLHEINTTDELVRFRRSDDGGYTWAPARTWAEAPMGGSKSYNHPVITSEFGTLWGFFTRWDGESPGTEIMRLESDDQMKSTGITIPRFIPFRPPEKMPDGNWLMAGELTWYEAAVAISDGDDFTKWSVVVIPRPDGLSLKYPETAILHAGDKLVAICRPDGTGFTLASTSLDWGRSWTPLQTANIPIHASQMFGGVLSTGQNYLICNFPAPDRRSLLAIAVTEPGGSVYRRIRKLRHQAYPVVRLFGGYAVEGRIPQSLVGKTTEWSYPGAVEREGNLYVSYTQGKEDCNLSIIPISALRVE